MKIVLGENIKKQRMSRKWTQKDLADKLMVSRQTISNWELGKRYPDIESLIRLSQLLAISTDVLLGLDKPQKEIPAKRSFLTFLFSKRRKSMMSHIKWFSGGNERKSEALSLIVAIQEELTDDTVGERELKALLSRFYDDLMSGTQSVPLTLSRLNISVADCLLHYHLVLSADNAERIEELTKLSQIRYGY